MATPLGDYVRAKRDATQPEDLGLPVHTRRRAPGLRRTEVATRAGISVEYLTRIEQGRDRNPSISVIHTIADALSLTAAERTHLRYLAKITGGACSGHRRPAPPNREVPPAVRATLNQLEPGIAIVTNGLGDVLAHTSGFETLMTGTGLLDTEQPNLTRYVFTHPNARAVFPHWDQIADEQAFNLWLGPSASAVEWFKADLAPHAGPEFTRRLDQHLPPQRVPLEITQPGRTRTRWDRETLDLPAHEGQQIIVFLPADQTTTNTLAGTDPHHPHATLRAV